MRKLWVTFLMTVMAGYIIGLNMVTPINSAISGIVTPAYNKSTAGVVVLLPLIAMIIIVIDSILSIDDHR